MSVKVYNAIMAVWDDIHTAQGFADAGALGAASGVASGLVCSQATADRTLNISAGRALEAGALFVNDAQAAIQLAANTSGTARTDVICAQTDWAAARAAFIAAGGVASLDAASAAAQAAAGSFVAIPLGTAPVQIPGTLWQEPLAQQVVGPGVGQLTTGLTDVRATPVPAWVSFSPSSGDSPFGSTITLAQYRIQRSLVTVELSRAIGAAFAPSSANWGDLNVIAPGNLPKPARPASTVFLNGHLNDIPVSLAVTPAGSILAKGGVPASSSVLYPSGSVLNATLTYPLG